MTQQNHRANVWITPETRAHLVAIGTAHGAAQGREMSPGIRVAAKYHSRLVEALRLAMDFIDKHPADPDITAEQTEAWMALQKFDARALLQELDNLEQTK